MANRNGRHAGKGSEDIPCAHCAVDDTAELASVHAVSALGLVAVATPVAMASDRNGEPARTPVVSFEGAGHCPNRPRGNGPTRSFLVPAGSRTPPSLPRARVFRLSIVRHALEVVADRGAHRGVDPVFPDRLCQARPV